MIGKAGLIAAIGVAAVVSGRSIDLRSLYDQMYPVSTLKRDVLYLCHEHDPTFIRAWRSDRVACYSGMPQAIALALGFIHPSNALSQLFSPYGGPDSLLAAAGLSDAVTMSREPPIGADPTAGKAPCRAAVAGLDKTPVHSIDDDKALAVLADRRHPVDRQGLMPTSVPGRGDSLSLLDDAVPRHEAPAASMPPSIGCASPS